MHRPTRQYRNLVAKVSEKRARSTKKKLGRKTKKWNKWIAQYAPLSHDGGAAPAS